MRVAVALVAIALSLVLASSLASCTEHGQGGAIVCLFMGESHVPGEVFSAGDGCNFCECISEGNVGRVQCSSDPCGDGGIVVDGGNAACAPSPGCDGPVCGDLCCAKGERCVAGTCLCGSGNACTNGDTCEIGGPIGGNETCGTTCCGATQPCPL